LKSLAYGFLDEVRRGKENARSKMFGKINLEVQL